jgi:hypothetical protein
MIPHFKKNLLHMKSSRKSFNKNSGSNCGMSHADIRLRKQENVVPEMSLEIMFHFRKIEVWTGSRLDKLMHIVIKVHRKVKERA